MVARESSYVCRSLQLVDPVGKPRPPGGLQIAQLPYERVVLLIADLGGRLLVVETVVPLDLGAQRMAVRYA